MKEGSSMFNVMVILFVSSLERTHRQIHHQATYSGKRRGKECEYAANECNFLWVVLERYREVQI